MTDPHHPPGPDEPASPAPPSDTPPSDTPPSASSADAQAGASEGSDSSEGSGADPATSQAGASERPDSSEGSGADPATSQAGASEGSDEEMVSLGDGLRAFRAWPLRRRVTFVLATLFVVLHVTAVLVRGAPKKWREPVWSWVSWYGEGLRMTDTWGMFSLPPKDKLVSVIGITESGDRVELSHVLQSERDFLQRVRDTRLRKIQTKLADEKSRNHWGWGYVKYFCKDALARGIPLRRIQLEVKLGNAEKPDVFLAQTCRAEQPRARGVR